ncbi:predicted protein [Sclerotinia sclerotiorum 1980 UF-70]|uniref:Uncharacterized protein n=1 Tax=Sclerotinia sclerotiorum (strain ATCC 18683 / 1980 / Ss-1) TaxID=665079 RepID=A7F6G0_SCLS1|nr:predicted protein [Sclerotinia sclerotiorum 1980 UF-70]EDN98331.1 predicted protein [Sclerotinia sclerotiorum 1980 UF-70]
MTQTLDRNSINRKPITHAPPIVKLMLNTTSSLELTNANLKYVPRTMKVDFQLPSNTDECPFTVQPSKLEPIFQPYRF